MAAPRSNRVAPGTGQTNQDANFDETDLVYGTRDWSSGNRLAGHLNERTLAAHGFRQAPLPASRGLSRRCERHPMGSATRPTASGSNPAGSGLVRSTRLSIIARSGSQAAGEVRIAAIG
jgi:hypothetical protein